MRGRHWKALAMATLAATAIAACGGEDTGDTTMDDPAAETGVQGAMDQQPMDLPEGVTQEQFTQGRQLFTGQGGCHACHGPQATGTQLAPDLTDDEWINLSGPDMNSVVQLIKSGVPQPVEHPGPMPPMGGANLTDEQVEALAAYVIGIAG